MTYWKRLNDLVWARALSADVVLCVFGDGRGQWNPNISLRGRYLLDRDYVCATRRRATFEARRETVRLVKDISDALKL